MLSFSGGTGVAGAYRQWVAEKERDREKDQARLPGAWTAATPARTPAKREKDAFFDRKRATRGDAGGGPAGRLQRENGTRGAEDGESGGERRSFAALDSLKREFETVLNSVAGSPATRTPGARTQTPRARVATGYAETPRSRSINSRLRSRSPRNATREMNQRLDDLIAKAEDLKNRFQSPVPAHGPQFGFGAADNNLEYYTPVKPSGAAQPTARSDPFEVLLSPEHDEDLFADFAFNPTSLPPRPNVPNSFFSPNYNSPMIIPERRDRDADRFRSPTNSASSKTSPSVPAQTPLHLPGAFPPTPYVAPRPQVDRPKDTPLKASVPGAFPESPYPYSARKPKTPATSAKLTSPSSSLTSPTDRLRGGNHSPLISPTDRARPADSRKVRFRSTVSEKTISWASPSVASPWSSVSGSWEPSPDFDRYGSELDEEEEQEDPIDRFVNEVGRIGGLVGDEKEEQVERERFDDADGFMDRMGDEDDPFFPSPTASTSRSHKPRSPPLSASPDLNSVGLGELYARAVAGTAPDEPVSLSPTRSGASESEDVWGDGFVDFGEGSVDLEKLADELDEREHRERLSIELDLHSDASLLDDARYEQPAPHASHTTPSFPMKPTPSVLPSPGTFFGERSGPIGTLDEGGVTPSKRPQFYTPSVGVEVPSQQEKEGGEEAKAFFQASSTLMSEPAVPVVSLRTNGKGFVLSPPPPVPEGPVEVRKRAVGWTGTPGRRDETPGQSSETPGRSPETPRDVHGEEGMGRGKPPLPPLGHVAGRIGETTRREMGSAVSERVERVERMEPSDRRQRREPAEPAQRFERSEPDFYQTTSPFHEREHALRQEREAVSTEMDDWKSPYSAHSRFPNPELPEKPSVSPREAPSANQRHASPSPPRRAPSPRKLSVDLEISTEGRDSLPKDATPEQIARWLGTELPDIHVNEKPALQRTIGPKSPLADAVIAKTPMPSDEWKSPLGVSKPSARLNSPDYKPPKAPVTISLTSPVITLPSTSYASIDRAGSPAPLSLVSLRLPWTSPGVTSRLRCTIKNPGTTNAPWMLSKVGHAKAQPPDSERPLLLEEDVFRWSDEKGVVAAEGETVLRLSFLPTFTGRFTQSFHMRCRGRVIVVEVVGIVGNRGAGTKEREALPSTPSYKTEAVQVQPPQTPFIRHPRLANLASTSTSDIPKSPTTPGFYTAEAESILEANSGGATPLFTLELLRRPPDSAPPTFREIGGERVQYFDFGRILSGDRAKITMRAVNPNRTSVLVRTALKGRDTRSFILPFRTLLVPRESFVPFPLVFEGKKSGMWEQEVELAASGGGGAFTRIRVVLVGEVV